MTDMDTTEISPSVEEFQLFHTTDVEKFQNSPHDRCEEFEIYPVFDCEICFVAIYAIFRVICFVAIYPFCV